MITPPIPARMKGGASEPGHTGDSSMTAKRNVMPFVLVLKGNKIEPVSEVQRLLVIHEIMTEIATETRKSNHD
jgi:hypothetical protein